MKKFLSKKTLFIVMIYASVMVVSAYVTTYLLAKSHKVSETIELPVMTIRGSAKIDSDASTKPVCEYRKLGSTIFSNNKKYKWIKFNRIESIIINKNYYESRKIEYFKKDFDYIGAHWVNTKKINLFWIKDGCSVKSVTIFQNLYDDIFESTLNYTGNFI